MAKRRIVDVIQNGDMEISWVGRGSHPLAKVILKKTADDPAAEQKEETTMLKSIKLSKALMVGGAQAAYLESIEKEADLDAFLDKDDTGRAAEVTTWVGKSGWKAPAEQTPEQIAIAVAKAKKDKEDQADGGADEDVEDAKLKKMVDAAVAAARQADATTIAGLTKSVADLSGGLEVSSLRKRAQTDFGGLACGEDTTVKILKGIAPLDEDVRVGIENIMKAHSEIVRRMAPALGEANLMKDATSATARLHKAASELASAEKIGFEQAFTKVCENPANAELVTAADREEAQLRGGGLELAA